MFFLFEIVWCLVINLENLIGKKGVFDDFLIVNVIVRLLILFEFCRCSFEDV